MILIKIILKSDVGIVSDSSLRDKVKFVIRRINYVLKVIIVNQVVKQDISIIKFKS